MRGSRRNIRYAIAVVAAVIITGTVGYRLIMGWTFIDCLYMTIITLATVGFREITPLTDAGKAFTIFLIFGGVMAVGYSVRVVAEYVIENNFLENIGKRRMEKKLAAMKNHIIVCGYGRIGQHVLEALRGDGKQCVVIERAPGEHRFDENTTVVTGDATDEDILVTAGIDRADVLVAVVGSDADNLFITMSARGMNPELRIISRATDAATRNKMLRAGADNVVLPYEIGGRRIASMVLTPTVCEFLDTVAYTGDQELRMEEAPVTPGSWLDGKTMLTADLRRSTGVVVLAVKRNSGEMLSNPPNNLAFAPGDRLISLGTPQQLAALRKIATMENEPG